MSGNSSKGQVMKKGKERVVGYVSRNIKELIREAVRSGEDLWLLKQSLTTSLTTIENRIFLTDISNLKDNE